MTNYGAPFVILIVTRDRNLRSGSRARPSFLQADREFAGRSSTGSHR